MGRGADPRLRRRRGEITVDVGNSVRKALAKADLGELDSAMLHACNGADGTAKKVHPSLGSVAGIGPAIGPVSLHKRPSGRRSARPLLTTTGAFRSPSARCCAACPVRGQRPPDLPTAVADGPFYSPETGRRHGLWATRPSLASCHPKADVTAVVPRLAGPVISFQNSFIVLEQSVAAACGHSRRKHLRQVTHTSARTAICRLPPEKGR